MVRISHLLAHCRILAQVTSFALIGLESTLVDVEVDISRGLPSQIIVGLPDAAVRESSERVRAALVNSGLIHARARLTVNLAPADRIDRVLDWVYPLAYIVSFGLVTLWFF